MFLVTNSSVMLHHCVCRYRVCVCVLAWLMRCWPDRRRHCDRICPKLKRLCSDSDIRFYVLLGWPQKLLSIPLFLFQCYTWCIRNCHWGGARCSNHGDHAGDKTWRYMATKASTARFKLLPVLLFIESLAPLYWRYLSQEISKAKAEKPPLICGANIKKQR